MSKARKRHVFLFGICLFFVSDSFAGLSIPSGLSSEDRAKALKIIGLGTTGKILSDPFPLGGYSGVEVGITMESLPTDDLSRLGSRTTGERSFTYPRISLGKGLFQNIDLFVHFLPYNQGTNMGTFGGAIRWAAFQAAFFPATFSVLIHGNNTNVGNVFLSETYGLDLITGVNVSNFALYLGGGKIAGRGTFKRALNQGQSSDFDETVEAIHGFFGITFNVDALFLAAQVDQYIDQYTQTTNSLKLGLRF